MPLLAKPKHASIDQKLIRVTASEQSGVGIQSSTRIESQQVMREVTLRFAECGFNVAKGIVFAPKCGENGVI